MLGISRSLKVILQALEYLPVGFSSPASPELQQVQFASCLPLLVPNGWSLTALS